MRELLSLSSERHPCSFLDPLAWLLVPLPLLRGLWILLLFPLAVWPYAERGIIIAAVASHFLSQKIGAFKSFVFAAQFHFGHNEAFVFAEELVHFKRVAARASGFCRRCQVRRDGRARALRLSIFRVQTHSARALRCLKVP